ncbi:MAG: ATP-binding cassette domain-containing protein [Candidatus Hodarchaeales archaeon]
MPVIRTEGLTKYYQREGVTALDSLDLVVPGGKIFGFLGPNGAGKTTTIKILLGFIKHYSGKVYLFDNEIEKNIVSIKHKIGFVPEGASLPKNLRVRTVLSATAKMHGIQGKSITESVNEVLKTIGMKKFANRKIGQMSKGQKQRIRIANALVHSPELLILDEPTSGLDAISRGKLLTFVKKWSRNTGGSIFVSSHVLSEIDRICDDVAILNHGKLLYKGPVEELRSRFITSEYYIAAKHLKVEEIARLEGIISIIEDPGNNSGLRVKVKDIEQGSRTLVRYLSENNCLVSDFHLVEPSLEDAFSKIVEADERSSGA